MNHLLPSSYQSMERSSSYISGSSSSSSSSNPDDDTLSLGYSSASGHEREGDNNDETNTLLLQRRHVHRRRSSSPSSSMKVWGLVLLSVGSIMILAPHVPWTQQERDIAAAYNLPLLGHAREIRASQRLANHVHDDHFIVHKIHKNKHHHKHHHGSSASDNNSTTAAADATDGANLPYMDVPENCEATVLLIRHCEKSNIREHCSYLGFERSVYLASQFGVEANDRWPLPHWIFAQRPNQRHNRHKYNFREVETVGPLAEKAGVVVDDSQATPNRLARELLTFLRTGQMCGKVAVVAWKHSAIGHMAHHLGCGPLQGCPVDYSGHTFDAVWQIKFAYRNWDHSDRKNLQLPSDPSWRVFGSVLPEGFDPLAFSKQVGDYPAGGIPAGGAWRQSQVAYPERKRVTDKRAWQATRVGFALPSAAAQHQKEQQETAAADAANTHQDG